MTQLPTDPADGRARGPGDAPLAAALAQGLREVRGRLARAAAAAGRERPPALLAVTKSVDARTTAALVRLLQAEAGGERPVDCAENRAADLERKAAEVAALAPGTPVRWHFVGHVQRNKARRIARLADVVHSVDSLRLVEALEAAATAEGKVLEVYVQVDFTGEATKGGLDAAGAAEALRACAAAPHLRPLGLMAMGPLVERPGATTRDVFARVAALARDLARDPALAAALPGGRVALSLGMSGDLEEAVAAGSTLVRVGSDLFRHLPAAPPALDA